MDHRGVAVRRRWRLLLVRFLWAGLLWLGLNQPCAALDWLVLAVDRSKSIDEHELALQRSAYIRLLSEPDVVHALEGAKVAIVEFDTRAQIVVDWADPAAAALAYQRKPPDGLRGQTGIGGALTTALALLAGKSGRLVIDVSGDGRDNVDPGLLAEARATATSQAIEVNGLAIMTPDTPEMDRYYSDNVANGFVLSVDRGTDFLNALKRKLFYEIAGGPTAPAPRTAVADSERDALLRSRAGMPVVRQIATAARSGTDRLRRPDGERR